MTVRPWKMVVGKLFSFLVKPLFSCPLAVNLRLLFFVSPRTPWINWHIYLGWSFVRCHWRIISTSVESSVRPVGMGWEATKIQNPSSWSVGSDSMWQGGKTCFGCRFWRDAPVDFSAKKMGKRSEDGLPRKKSNSLRRQVLYPSCLKKNISRISWGGVTSGFPDVVGQKCVECV